VLADDPSFLSRTVDLFQRGGLVMWPILFCSVLALTITLERLLALRRNRVLDPEGVARITALVEAGRAEEALAYARSREDPFSRIVRAGLEHLPFGLQEVKEAIENAGRQEAPGLQRFIGALGTIAAITPLLGLLGTVLGMIRLFQDIKVHAVGDPDALSGGIEEALLTTAFGLSVAIPTLVVFNILRDRSESILRALERACLGVIRRLQRPGTETSTGREALGDTLSRDRLPAPDVLPAPGGGRAP
jgi:biopolymer transport protein ExbB